MDRRRHERRATVLGVVATTAVILPAFLTGAVAVQLRAGLGLSASQIGLAIGAFFAGSALGSTHLGRLAERLGGPSAIGIGLGAAAAANLVVAGVVDGPDTLVAAMVAAGLGNALAQPGVNLMLVETIDPERLGFATALKQSGMPTAALLGGAAVPAVALTVGWRACYLLAAGLALSAIPLSWRAGRRSAILRSPQPQRPADPEAGPEPAPRPAPGRPDLPLTLLLIMAAVGVFGGAAANSVVGYLVSGAVDAGVAPGPAGLLLTMGSTIGVTSRLVHGHLVDRGRIAALPRVMTMFAIGSAAVAALSIHDRISYLAATPLVFAAGWAWPGLFNLVVLNANRSAPAAATGITQAGVYVGSVIGPVATGLVVETAGYRQAWLVSAVLLAAAGATTWEVRRRLASTPGTSPGQEPTGPDRAQVPSEPRAGIEGAGATGYRRAWTGGAD